MTTLRPFGPRVTRTAFASASTPRSSERRALSSYCRIFGMRYRSSRDCATLKPRDGCGPTHAAPVPCGSGATGQTRTASELLVDDREDVTGGEHQVLLAVVLDLGAAVLAVEDAVAFLDVERNPLAVFEAARTDGKDDALLGLLLRGVRDDQAGSGGRLSLDGLDNDAVLERPDGNLAGGGGRHCVTPPP